MGGTDAEINVDKDVPTELAVLPPVVAVSFGGAHACALTTQGKVWCWGNNDDGQLGYDSGLVLPVSNHPPYEIPTLSDVIAIDAGTNHNMCPQRQWYPFVLGCKCRRPRRDVERAWHWK